MSLPPSDKPKPSMPDDASSNTGSGGSNTPAPDNSGNSAGSTPPRGSKGYRKHGDPLPRGIPLTGAPRRSNKAAGASTPKPSSPTPSSSAGQPPVNPPAKSVRPQSPTSGQEQPRSNQPPVVRPPTPPIIHRSIGDTSSVVDSPKVPLAGSPRRSPSPSIAPPRPDAAYSPVAAAMAKSAASAAAAAAAKSQSPPPVAHQPPVTPVIPAPPMPTMPPDAMLPSQSAFPAPADRRGLFMVIAVLVSLVAHAALAYELYDRPLSYIDPALIHQQREVYRVFRAPQDLIITDAPSDTPVTEGQTPAQTKPQSPLADLSISMLSAPDEEQPKPALSSELQSAARPFDDSRPKTLEPEGAQGLPDIQLPDNIQQQLKIEIPLATSFVGSGGSSNKGAGSGASSKTGAGSGQDHAASLLAQGDGFGDGIGDIQGRGFGVPGNPLPPTMSAPTLTDKAEINDRRTLPADLMPAPLDLSSITNNAATRLSIPEHLDNDFDYNVTTFIPKGGWGVSKDEERGYFQVNITAKRSLKKLQTMPKDLVILVDTSGSVPQEWLDRTLSGLEDSLASLNPEDRFNIVFFAEKTAVLGPDGNLPVTDANLAKARNFLASGKSGGDTDVNQALSRLLVRDVAVDRAYELILISDGRPTKGVLGTRELINLITRDNDLAVSIYCLGIGPRQNKTLLEFLAYRNKGFCVFAEDPFQAAIGIRDLVSRLRYPIMKDIRLTLLGLNIEEVFPSDLPTIHQGESFSIFGRFDNPGKPFTMRLIGHNGKQMFDFTFTRDLTQAPNGPEQISRDWGFWKLHHLYNQILRHGESRELRMAITYLRRKYKLETLYE